MEYKGDSYLDSGYFYAPYLPLVSTPVIDAFWSIPNVLKDDTEIVQKPPAPKYRSIDEEWQSE